MKRRVMNIVITGAIIIVSFVLQSYLSLVSGQSFVVPNLLLIVTRGQTMEVLQDCSAVFW